MKNICTLLILCFLLFSCKGKEVEIPDPVPPVEEVPDEEVMGDVSISFVGNVKDTLFVNPQSLPTLTVEVRAKKGLANIIFFRINQDASTSVAGSPITSFDSLGVHRHTLSTADLGLTRAGVVGLRVTAEDIEENYAQRHLVYFFIDPATVAPEIRWTNVTQDTLKVNSAPNAAKPTPCFEVVASNLDTVKLFVLKRIGSSVTAYQVGATQTSFTQGTHYEACFDALTYTDDMVGLRIVAVNNRKHVARLDLPLKVALDLNAAPIVNFLTGTPFRVNTHVNATKPYVQFRVTSAVGLQKLVLWRINYDSETKLAEITSFTNNKDFVREIAELLPAHYTGLERLEVDAYDVSGKFTKAVLPIESYSAAPAVDQNVAFPGAEGFGAVTTTGGRGGAVYYVTNLNDNGPGSLRDAVSKSNGTVVFKVSGVIELNSTLRITGSNLTIAGQTAPGDGICLKNHTTQVRGSNIVVRFMRFRMGDEKGTEGDAFEGQNQSNIIIDHCSMSWSTDECSSFYDNANFTMQWCIIAESLRISVHDKGAHGYGGIWGGKGASFHHNLLANHDSRNPRFCGSRYSQRADLEKCDFRNNVVYNWGGNSGYAGEGGSYNFVNNYYKPAAGTASGVRTRIFSPNGQDQTQTTQQPGNVWGKFWLSGNYMDGSASVTADNWLGLQPNASTGSPLPGSSIENIKLSAAFEVNNQLTHSAETAYSKVLTCAGASHKRDAVDERIVREVRNGEAPVRAYFTRNPGARPVGTPATKTGMIDTQQDVGGWPVYNALPAPLDTDGDGIPDAWEAANGLNPNNAADGSAKTLSGIYTNLEVYLNSLVQHILEEQFKQ